jgi:hypothetical protein
LVLIPIIIFYAFIGASYYFDKNQLPKEEVKSVAPLPVKVENNYPESSNDFVAPPPAISIPQDKYYTPFIIPGPSGTNLYYVSRPDGGYDQVWGPQIK